MKLSLIKDYVDINLTFICKDFTDEEYRQLSSLSLSKDIFKHKYFIIYFCFKNGKTQDSLFFNYSKLKAVYKILNDLRIANDRMFSDDALAINYFVLEGKRDGTPD